MANQFNQLVTDTIYYEPVKGLNDSSAHNYIGYEKHPHGNSPNHFESQYYKEFLRLLDKCIIESNIL